MPAGEGPLAGIRVIDLTIWMAGPVAGMLLADLGADVIKVESPNGDPARNSGGMDGGTDTRANAQVSLFYSTCNRNKQTVTLDLTDELGKEAFKRLIAGADVFLSNLNPRTLRSIGADEETLHEINPHLIYARSAGLGHTGPRAEDNCQDMTGMAYAGLVFTYGQEPDEPFAPPGAMNDVMTGTMVAFGVLAAVLERQRTGKGQTVSGSLVQTSLWAQVLQIGSLANTTGAPTAVPRTRKQPRSPIVNQYKCGDGKWLAIAAIMERYWPIFVEAIGIEHLTQDPRFSSYAVMMQHPTEMREELDKHFATAPADEWLERMRARNLWCGRANRLEDVLVDDHIAANEYLTTLDDGARTVTMPFSLDGYRPPTKAGPVFGADTAAVLRELGLDNQARQSSSAGATH